MREIYFSVLFRFVRMDCAAPHVPQDAIYEMHTPQSIRFKFIILCRDPFCLAPINASRRRYHRPILVFVSFLPFVEIANVSIGVMSSIRCISNTYFAFSFCTICRVARQ